MLADINHDLSKRLQLNKPRCSGNEALSAGNRSKQQKCSANRTEVNAKRACIVRWGVVRPFNSPCSLSFRHRSTSTCSRFSREETEYCLTVHYKKSVDRPPHNNSLNSFRISLTPHFTPFLHFSTHSHTHSRSIPYSPHSK